MRTRFEQLCKQVTRAALEHDGSVETEVEVSVETRRIDLQFTPNGSRRALQAHLGLLGRMTREPSTFEFFHRTPSADELLGCVHKHGDFRHCLSQRKSPPPMPIQWVVSSGRPTSGINGLWLRQMTGWPPGIYEAAPFLHTRLVVVNELPTTRDTLLVRLYAAGAALSNAIAELERLPEDAPERALARPILLRLALEVPSDPVKRTPEDEEYLMHTQDILKAWETEVARKGRVEGRVEGLAQAVIRAYWSRFGAVPDDLRVAIEAMNDELTLERWIDLIVTVSADEVGQAIRRARSS